jgi:hypothetical protein
MEKVNLYMLLLGCTPPGRHIEQHDIFFSIGTTLASLKPSIFEFWPEAGGKIHVDAWRSVNQVDGFQITVEEREPGQGFSGTGDEKLFFINLGGYKRNEFEEFHYKMLAVGKDKSVAVQKSMKTSFYLHTGYDQANSHVDDKYGVDVDELYQIEDILPGAQKEKYRIVVSHAAFPKEDEIFLGYFKLDKL